VRRFRIMLSRGWDRRTIVLLTIALLFVILASLAQAQVFDLERDHVQMAELSGFWRFHTGDDPDGKLGWANPAFDDSGWSLLKPDRSWFTQGYPNYAGLAWYRISVSVPDGKNDLAIFLPGVQSSYAIYANGNLIGEIGQLPPHPQAIFAPNELFSIPRRLVVPGRPLLIAVRVWYWPILATSDGGGIDATPALGDAAQMARWRDLQIHDAFWANAISCVSLAANFLSAILALALFALRRGEREYLWFGLAQICWTISVIASLGSTFLRTPVTLFGLAFVLGTCGGIVLNLVFFHALLHARRRVLFWIGSVPILLTFPLICLALAGWMSLQLFFQLQLIGFVPYAVAQCALLVRAAWKRNAEALLIVVPFTLSCLALVFNFTLAFVDMSRHPRLAAFNHYLSQLITWPFTVDSLDLLGVLCISSVCGVLILRFARTRRDEERFKGELEAARTVQQVLIPEEIPTIPGLMLDCIYRPAGQVGGDFFQVIPTENKGALIVIGDVSGKGMPAAMAVSLLVGTVRTLAHYMKSPAAILDAMNQRMLARSRGGFTTCLVLRIDGDGSVAVANAGHLAPYVAAQEISVDFGLPLGISAESVYAESAFCLEAGEELTLLTDGVAEARTKSGHLFGFERTASISILSAAQIAATAVAFGQQDDITVLKIRRSPAPEPAVPLGAATATSSA
jgi:serine phosphatase RsbU (regulator of sigma subunit)